MSQTPWTAPSHPLRTYWAHLLALFTTVLVLAHLSWSGYQDALRKAEATSEGIARVNAFALNTTLDTADMLLSETADIIAPALGDPALLQKTWQGESLRLAHYLARIPQIDSIRVFNASGVLILSTDSVARKINIADRLHFQQAKADPNGGLVISEVVLSRTTDRLAVVLLRPIHDAQGRFLGVVSAPLDLSYFKRLLADVNLGEGGAAVIRRSDTSAIVMRHPLLPGSLNRTDPDHPIHREIQAGRTSGLVAYIGKVDGTYRISSFQKLEHFPLYVVVGLSHAETLREWRWRALASTLLVAAAFLSVLLFYRRMARSNRLLESVLEAASEVAIIATDSKGTITLFNRGARNLLGFDADEILGKKQLDSFLDTVGQESRQTISPGTLAPRHGEWAYRRKDGSTVQVSQVITPLPGAGEGRQGGYLCVAHDISQRKRTEGLQAAQSRILEMIAGNTPLPRILDRLVRGIEARAEELTCAILLFDEASSTLRLGAAPSLPEDFRQALDGLSTRATSATETTADFLRHAVLTEDIQRDPGWAVLHEAARRAGIHACWSTPIEDADGRLLGTFSIYSKDPALAIAAEEKLMDMATHTAAIGIVSARAADALRAGEERLRLALHAANMDAFEYSPKSGRVRRHGSLTRRWDLPVDGLAEDYFQRIHNDDRDDFLHLLAGLTPNEPDYAAEYRLRGPDGTYVWIADWASATFDPAGYIERVLGVFCDISGRKALEAELFQHQQHLEQLVAERTSQLSSSEAHIRLILESTADGLYGVDTLGRLTFINRAACGMLGITAEAVIGQSIHERIHHHHADGRPYPAALCPTVQTLRSGNDMTIEDEVYWHADGHPIPVIYTTHPMLRDGRIVGAVISFMDVTDRRAMEQAREQAREAAERLARVKSEFLANMSHEIRTPLNGVLGLARIGYRDNAGRKAQNLFARILDSGGLLLGVVNDILDFSKIEAGKLHLEAIPVDLPRLLRNTADALRERSDGKELKLSVELAPDLPPVCSTDPLRLRQILTNLLSNAIKFTGQGEVKLFAGLENDNLLLRVSDTGIGMDEQQLARLFIAFEQADTSTTRRFGGTGLGLAITKRLTELFGGTIRADSRPGCGSHFEVRIPYASGDLPFMHDQASSHHALPDRQRLAGISVLVAEDNEVNQMVLEDLLLSEGARLEVVHNGRAAVERVAEAGSDTFQLVLMDIQMPEMDGYEATRRIRAKAPHLPIIGQTAHAMAEEKAKCLEAGMMDHIAKPIDLEVLVATILRHVQRLPDSAASGRTTRPAMIHWQDLEARYAGKPEFIRKLLGVFINSQTPVIEEIRTTAASGDTEKLVRQAHSLKGSAGNIMARSLMGLALETEHAARDNRPEAMALACDLADLLDATLAEIADRLKG